MKAIKIIKLMIVAITILFIGFIIVNSSMLEGQQNYGLIPALLISLGASISWCLGIRPEKYTKY
ncbi:MAG: hypothetical protein K0R00_1253 [Herbinix sp.]|nr:hypothetical protein [Herbinix sp.]